MIYPVRVTKQELERHVNLLLTEQDGVWHYSTIKNFNGLMRTQYTNYHGKYFFCYSCLHGFAAKENEKSRKDCKLLQEHVKYCKQQKAQRISYPQNKNAEFTNIQKTLKQPFVGYADFESILERTKRTNASQEEEEVKTSISPIDVENLDEATTKREKKEFEYQSHTGASYFTKFVSVDPDFAIPEHDGFEFPQKNTYVGENAAENFLDYVQTVAEKIYKKYIQKPKEMIYTESDIKIFENSNECHICKNKLVRQILHCHREAETTCSLCNDDPPDIIVRDHCHITGVFRGAAHQSCNLNYRIIPKRWKLPIFFHNLRGYDGHLLIRAVQKRHGSIRVIPTNMEKYLAISIGQVQFLDSLQFTMKSLDNLVGTLDSSDFKYTRAFFPNEEQFHLMTQKGIFPYDFFDNFSKLNYNHFPPREAFYNTLANEECSIKDYLHGELVWNKFNCKTFKDYHDLYLKSDVLLLTDFFEKFRNECINSYGLDAAHYFSAPGMAWDAALKLTEVQLQLFDNEEMYTFLERSIRGGVSQISKRVAIANNENCQDFDPLKPISHLIYLDANNLYGWAMSQSLPTHDFRWLTFEEIANLDIRNISSKDDAEYGYIYEVDLHYPDNLHDLHNDYPLAPERLTIDESMLSNFQQEKFPASQKKTSVKLSPNLRDKTNYVVHYRNLKFYLEQGLIITKIHKVLSFKQSPWLKP